MGTIVLFGEKNRVVPMSKNRVEKIDVFDNSIEISIVGNTGENVTFYGLDIENENEFEVSKTMNGEHDVLEVTFVSTTEEPITMNAAPFRLTFNTGLCVILFVLLRSL